MPVLVMPPAWLCAMPMLAMPPAWLRVGMVGATGIEPVTPPV